VSVLSKYINRDSTLRFVRTWNLGTYLTVGTQIEGCQEQVLRSIFGNKSFNNTQMNSRLSGRLMDAEGGLRYMDFNRQMAFIATELCRLNDRRKWVNLSKSCNFCWIISVSLFIAICGYSSEHVLTHCMIPSRLQIVTSHYPWISRHWWNKFCVIYCTIYTGHSVSVNATYFMFWKSWYVISTR
jgi:hypothetical protein